MRYALLLLLCGTAAAQGMVLPDSGPARLGEHRVEAEIFDRIATVTVTQTFRNETDREFGGTYLFVLPRGATVSSFAMTMGGKMVEGEVIDADKARAIFRAIVERRRDPGLLEYVGHGLFRARVFPIPARGEVEVRLRFEQILPEDEGTVEFRYPLATERMHREPVGQVLVDVKYEGSVDLRSVFCATHRLGIVRKGERAARATYEASDRRQERDVVIYFGRSAEDVGLTVLAHKPVAEDGTFVAVLAPPTQVAPEEIVPKDVIYVLDRSGSMQGDKLVQAKQALSYGIDLLRGKDRFNVITFSTEWWHFKQKPIAATAEAKAAAKAWLEEFTATGGTALEAATKMGLRQAEAGRLCLVVLLTDGRPTIGVTDPEMILEQIEKTNTAGARVFTFGVGHDLDVRLLDRIAEATRGARDYVAPHEEIGTVTGRFFRKIDQPVLTDLELEFQGGVSQVYPRRLPDLFAGDQLVLLGRYAEGGEKTIRLRGRRGGAEVVYEYRARFADDKRSSFLPRLWAQRKIAFLLDEIRLHGQQEELVEEIKSLARRYSIVTPYTAGLVVEDGSGPSSGPIFFASRREARSHGGGGAYRGPAGGVFRSPGGVPPGLREPSDAEGPTTPAAVSKDIGALKKTTVVNVRTALKVVEDASFRRDGKGRWIDTRWDGKAEPKRIEAFSEAYFALVDEDPRIGKYLALGEKVVFVWKGEVYEVVCAES